MDAADETHSSPSESKNKPNDGRLAGLTENLDLDSAVPAPNRLIGQVVGGVTIVRLIAEGGMGMVYEGRQERPNRTVALKVMRPGLATPSMLKRFQYEAEVLGRLQHPGIAHIYSVGVHQVNNASVPYFVMEYIADAKTLTKYADEHKMPTRQRLDLFRSVCDAVAHGHHKGVIHRDLKPSNILVDASGQPKVIDFGVARVTNSDMAITTMNTDVGQLIGTLQYMSPEQFDANPAEVDVRTDVYALGVILYELLAGKPPYDVRKKAVHEIMRIVQEEDPIPLSSLNRALKGDVAVIAGKCLEKQKRGRYSNASELSGDISRYLSGNPITARPPRFFGTVARFAKRHNVKTLLLAGIIPGILLYTSPPSIAHFGNATPELVIVLCIFLFLIAPPIIIAYVAAMKNRSRWAWGVPAILGPVVAIPLYFALALASYLCPKCRQSLTKGERRSRVCPHCGCGLP